MKSNLPIDEALYEQGYNQAIKDLDICDWQAFRREIAMKMLPVTATMKITKNSATVRMISKEGAARLAIEYADELINQLKQE